MYPSPFLSCAVFADSLPEAHAQGLDLGHYPLTPAGFGGYLGPPSQLQPSAHAGPAAYTPTKTTEGLGLLGHLSPPCPAYPQMNLLLSPCEERRAQHRLQTVCLCKEHRIYGCFLTAQHIPAC